MFKIDTTAMTFSVDTKRADALGLNGRYESFFFIWNKISGDTDESLPTHILKSFRFVIFLSKSAPYEPYESDTIKIDKPFATYYLENKDKLPFKMNPPSERQILEALTFSQQNS